MNSQNKTENIHPQQELYENQSPDENETDQKFCEIGTYLKSCREKRKMSLEDVAKKTRINLTLLKELESNHFEALPDKTYVRGFIKSYIREVGGSLELGLKNLHQSYENIAAGKKNYNSVTLGEETFHQRKLDVPSLNDANKPDRYLFIKLSAFFTICLALYCYYLFQNNPSLPINETPPAVTHQESVEDTTITPAINIAANNTDVDKEKTENKLQETTTPPAASLASMPELKDSLLKINEKNSTQEILNSPKSINAAPPEDKKEEKVEEKETKKISFSKFSKISGSQYTLDSSSPEALNTEILPLNIKNAVKAGEENVYIKALDGNSWITYKIDDKPIKSFTLQKDHFLFLQGKKIRILMGNVQATRIFLNNQLVNYQTESSVKSLVFPLSWSSEVLYPLFVHQDDGQIFTSEEYVQKTKDNKEN